MEPTTNNVPLCVDLDGTLVKTDLLVESIVLVLKANPLKAFLLPVWMSRGKAFFKHRIAQEVEIDVSHLPYNRALLEFLIAERRKGRELVLATASNKRIAEKIAAHLGIFSKILASDGQTNLSGKEKLDQLLKNFGAGQFDYAGNHSVDMPIWRQTRKAIVVNASGRLIEKVSPTAEVSHVFEKKRLPIKDAIRSLRPHQWVKNLLIFVSLAAAHKLSDAPRVWQACVAFASFCLCASSVYALNDLVDLEADRQHPRKRHRPFASGALPLLGGLALVPGALALSAILALMLPRNFQWVLAGYFLTTLTYSFYFKRQVLLDVIILAGLYTLRIFAGGVAVQVSISAWLMAFSMFFFLSLAFAKRFAELVTLRRANKEHARGRGYFASDLEQLASLGASSGYISVLVLALYINSQEVTRLYARPAMLWLICPILLYWISRIWLWAHRGRLNEDPIIYALSDGASYIVAFLCVMVLYLAAR